MRHSDLCGSQGRVKANGMDAPAFNGINCAKVEVSSNYLTKQPLRFLPWSPVHLMPHSTDMVINDFAQPIRDAERLVIG
jgi:hypothetical protein